jgi:hypothetical protein
VIFCLYPGKVRHEIRNQKKNKSSSELGLYYSVHNLLISNLPAAGEQHKQNNMHGCAGQDLKPILREFTGIISKMSTKNSGK